MTALSEAVEQHFAVDENGLMACPLCGAGETLSNGKYLPLTMKGKGALISWEIHHWCEKKAGVVAQSFNVRGRTQEDAIIAYNTRTSDALIRELWRRLGVVEEKLQIINQRCGVEMDYGSGSDAVQNGYIISKEALAAIRTPFEGGK